MEECRENLKKWMRHCFEGEVTMPKSTFWLAAAVCLLAGVVYGLLAAPRCHGIHKMVGCNNGNSYCTGEGRCCQNSEEEERA